MLKRDFQKLERDGVAPQQRNASQDDRFAVPSNNVRDDELIAYRIPKHAEIGHGILRGVYPAVLSVRALVCVRVEKIRGEELQHRARVVRVLTQQEDEAE